MRNFIRSIVAGFLAYFTLGVDAPDPDPDPLEGADPDADPDPDGEADPDPDAEPGNADPDPDGDDPATLRASIARERAARETAERTAREAQIRYEESQRSRGAAAPPVQNDEQRLYQEEEERLRDPALTVNEKWYIESSRSLRASRMASEQALRNSQDVQDRVEFDRICAARPGLAKRYGEQVEKRLKDIRSTGGNLARGVILRMVIGDDIVEGKLKSAGKKPAAKPAGEERNVRGTPPRSRSDVSGRGKQPSDREKLREKLRDVQI